MDARSVPPGYRRRAVDELPSTNAAAFAAARAGEGSGLWIAAAEQTAGRGRRGRPWRTGRGNLAASLMLIDPAVTPLAPTLSFVGAVALHKAAVDAAGAVDAGRLAVKWPNDLLLDRRKVAGILIEGERLLDGRLAVAIGFGVNCVSHPDLHDQHGATDFAAAGITVGAEALFDALAIRAAEEIASWDRGAGFAATRAAWLARAIGSGEPVRVNLAGRTVEGSYETLDEEGRLIVRRADGTREAFSAGDVFFAAVAGQRVGNVPV
jgi:BirA family biotin operon repressor/biotin-[acetyl-CoA-carboxylase] ligase